MVDQIIEYLHTTQSSLPVYKRNNWSASFYLTMLKRQREMESSKRVLRSATKAKFNWASLPAEIRLMILEEALGHRHRSWASCAVASKEWQTFVEQKNSLPAKIRGIMPGGT